MLKSNLKKDSIVLNCINVITKKKTNFQGSVVVSFEVAKTTNTKAALPHAFSACVYYMWLRFQSNYFENATTCSEGTLKMRVAMQL